MKKMWIVAGSLALALGAGNVQAADFPVTGSSASALAGQRAFIELVYDYGAGFGVIAEDLQFEYEFAGMTFNADASTIDVFGAPQSLPVYADSLRTFALAHFGGVLVNLNPVASLPGRKGYALSFFTADGTPQMRSGLVHLRVAFDVLPSAQSGFGGVSFTDKNLLADELGNEFTYPIALQSLGVTALSSVGNVPELPMAWMLLPGLALIGLRARRRAERQP